MATAKNPTTVYPCDQEDSPSSSCEDLEADGFERATAYVNPESGEVYVLVDGSEGPVWTVVGSR